MYGYENMTIEELKEELKKEYRKIAKKWFPDLQPPEKREAATRGMQRLNQKYSEVLERITS